MAPLPTDKNQRVWIISPARYTKWTFDEIGQDKTPHSVREHRISDIGHYLISPKPLQVERWLVGCEIHWRQSGWNRFRKRFWRSSQKKGSTGRRIKMLMSDFSRPEIPPEDDKLNRHLQSLQQKLRPFDSLIGALDQIDSRLVTNVVGTCEDDGGNRSQLSIAGDTRQQMDFVRTYAGKKIDVRLNRAQFADGLFEMKGFDFRKYDPDAAYRLLRLIQDGQPKACVLNKDRSIAFWMDDAKLVNYLQLFEFSIQKNRHMRESLQRCILGDAIPMRLMFNHALEIDYSKAPLPTVFKEALAEHPFADQANQLIKNNLNLHQVGVSFNSYAIKGEGDTGVRTDISILQNLRALEPIKKRLPKLFAEITKRASHSDAGNFYLLDAIRGGRHEA